MIKHEANVKDIVVAEVFFTIFMIPHIFVHWYFTINTNQVTSFFPEKDLQH